MVRFNYSDYSNNGECRFENFPECLNNPTEMELGSAGGVRWFMKLFKMPNDTRFAPMIYFKSNNRNIQVGVAIYYSAWNHRKDGEIKKMMNPTDRFTVSPIEIFFRRPTTITIYYGIHVESIKSENGIWKFNFAERHIDFKKNLDELTIKFDDSYTTLHCPKQLLKFHSPVVSQYFSKKKPAYLSDQTIHMKNFCESTAFEKCLQIAYGVRPRLRPVDYDPLLIVAEKFKLQNVIRYIEQEMIQQQYAPENVCNKCRNLKRYMANFLKRLDSFEQFGKICRYWEISQLRSEIVKMILDKFMETEF